MDLYNLQGAVDSMTAPDMVRIANEARPPADYLFNTILPERNRYTYEARTAGMTVRATMAGLSGMDSPYPPVGQFEVNTFSSETAKVSGEAELNEATLRELQQLMLNLRATNQPTNQAVQTTLLNFLDKIVVQAHLDTFEWLRGQALSTGKIQWTFNSKILDIDYGIDSSFFFNKQTSTSAWDKSASTFWSDIRALKRKLRKYGSSGVRFMAHPDTIDAIRYNTANAMAVVNEGDGAITFRKLATDDSRFTLDASDSITLVSYGLEGEIFDLANPGQTITVPFLPTGKIIAVAGGARQRFIVGDGSTTPSDLELGYTHLSPTVEGGGNPGRWSNVYVPPSRPWTVVGRAVTNGLPVIEALDRFAVASSEIDGA